MELFLTVDLHLQAIGRVHRIGQTKPTFVHKVSTHAIYQCLWFHQYILTDCLCVQYLVEKTVEVRVNELFKQNKAAILGGGGASGAIAKGTEKMSAEDARFLLGQE